MNLSSDGMDCENHESPRYRTRSQLKSLSDGGVFESPRKLRFPFFDESNTSTSRNYDLRPSTSFQGGAPHGALSPMMGSSRIGADLSPIQRGRGSDASAASISVPSDAGGDCELERLFVKEDPQSAQSMGDTTTTSNEDMKLNDLSNARKQVGQSSNDFIQRIRNAAHKRKVAMTRSRDSLVAKEEEQRRTKAEARAKADEQAAAQTDNQISDGTLVQKGDINHKQNHRGFKARPLPATTGMEGSGGLDGIPKVAKKPTTVPFSPQLGLKRRAKIEIKALQAPKVLQPKPVPARRESPRLAVMDPPKEVIRPFKARPVPKAVGALGYGGQYGVPKVAKRPVTIPNSPLLGPRRRDGSPITEATHSNPTRTRGSIVRNRQASNESITVTEPRSRVSAQSPSLLGLDILDLNSSRGVKTVSVGFIGENDENESPRDDNIQVFQPRSSARAKKRAAYEREKTTTMKLKTMKNTASRQREIRRLRRELQVLRQEL